MSARHDKILNVPKSEWMPEWRKRREARRKLITHGGTRREGSDLIYTPCKCKRCVALRKELEL